MTPHDVPPVVPRDISEVHFLEIYQPLEQPTHAARPLIDIVNPQPKAFFAYLQMPKPTKPAAKKATKRVSRRKQGDK